MPRILEIDEELTYGKRPLKAMDLFTDRKEPLRVALSEYEKLQKEMRDGVLNTHVIYYYGEGGIGKSTLIEKLEETLDGKDRNEKGSGHHVKLDFKGFSGGKLNVVEDLACKLAEKYGYRFPRTTIALKRLYEPHLKGTRLEDRPLAKSKKMEFLLSCLKILPNMDNYVELVASIIDFLLPKFGFVVQRKNLRTELESIAAIDIKDVEEHLPIYFSHDLNMNTAKAKHPLTIFLDTYEQYINQFESDFESAQEKDEWLRDSCDGVIPHSKRILWIITGRNKLIPIKGGKAAESWRSLEVSEHLLELLSKADTKQYLDYCGITDRGLRRHLAGITHGSPVLLDFCYQIYCKLRGDPGKQLDPAQYGIDREKLKERFLQQYDAGMRQMILGLAALENGWNDEILGFVRPSITGFDEVKYRQLLNESFIHRNEDGSYSMSNAVRSVLASRLDPSDRQRIDEAYKRYLSKCLKDRTDIDANILRMLKGILASGTDVLGRCLSEIMPTFDYMVFNYRFEIPTQILSTLKDYATRRNLDKELAVLVCVEHAYLLSRKGDPRKAYAKLSEMVDGKDSIYAATSDKNLIGLAFNNGAMVLRSSGRYAKAKELDEECLRLGMEVHGEKHYDTLISMNHLAYDYKMLEMNDKALELDSKALKLKREILGERHPDTLAAMTHLAYDYAHLGMRQKALELDTETLRLKREIRGDRHPKTLISMNNLAHDYRILKMPAKALKLDEEALRISKEVIGEKHPDTLLSMSNLATDYRDLGMLDKAFELDTETLRLRKEVLGERHPDTLLSMSNLAFDCIERNMNTKALDLLTETLRLRKEVLGNRHPKTLTSMDNLVYVYKILGMNDKAAEIKAQLQELRKKDS